MHNILPRWRGFNLMEMYIFEPGRENILPGALTGPGGYGGGDGDFREQDLQWISEWGFDFIRLPMDYRYWTIPNKDATFSVRESVLARLDRIIELGKKYALHVCLNLHRAPGYCVNSPAEPSSLWTDRRMKEMFAATWKMFAERYRNIDSQHLSFDLLNEPPVATDQLKGLMMGSEMSRRDHESVMRAAIAAIHSVDPNRLIIVDGLNYGTEPLPELIDLAPSVAQSCRGYGPFGITHYQAPWVTYPFWRKAKWPGADHFGRTWGIKELEAHFQPWADLIQRGVGVHCGEWGFFSKTPHDVGLAWMQDLLHILHSHHIGWALWNFRGDFGILDSNRTDMTYEPFRGHLLDRKMLDLLRAN